MGQLWSVVDGEPFMVNPHRIRSRNALGETLTIVGGLNPRRRRRTTRRRAMPKSRHRSHHRARHNMMRSRHHRRPYRRHRNARRRAGFRLFNRGYRRNPVVLSRPSTWAKPLLIGGLSASLTTTAPAVLMGTHVKGLTAYLTQAGVAIGGGLLVPLLTKDPTDGLLWFVVGGGIILADLIGKSIVSSVVGAVLPKKVGMGAYSLDAPYYPTAMAPPYAYMGAMTRNPYKRHIYS